MTMNTCARPDCDNRFERMDNKKYCSETCSKRMQKRRKKKRDRLMLREPICDNPSKLYWVNRNDAEAWARYQTLKGNHQKEYLCRGCAYWHVYTVKPKRTKKREDATSIYRKKYPLLFPDAK